ncbi:hypothetical protein B296_00053898 [Ensete ventricosum]|uniref:Uncharacterized protein n=1 Tax=Ensete ventricosum TaxID=4639 RepID=A0A426Y612_ENSVE|nr:hypothetical protein B296_00053898 [Ensete ventricosum]
MGRVGRGCRELLYKERFIASYMVCVCLQLRGSHGLPAVATMTSMCAHLAERVNSGTGQEEGVRETSRLLPRVSSSEAPSSIDAKSQRDLEVMKACHAFDLTVIEGSLVAIWKRYSIPGSTHCVLRCSSSNLTTQVPSSLASWLMP